MERSRLSDGAAEGPEDRFADAIATMPAGVWRAEDARLIAGSAAWEPAAQMQPPAHIPFLRSLVWAMALGSAAVGVALVMGRIMSGTP